jgi:hypothetical protein
MMDLRSILYHTTEPIPHAELVQKCIAFTVLACFLFLSFRNADEHHSGQIRKWTSSPWVYLGSLFFLLLAFRWTALLAPMLNGDEAQFIAAGQKLGENPIFWRSVDINTGGPLNAYLLHLVGMLGLEINFASARLMGILLNWLTLSFLFLGIRSFTTDRNARIWLLPTALCVATMRWSDNIHYTGELLSVTLLSMLLFLFLLNSKQQLNRYQLVTWGAVLALIPYAKIQALPIAVAITASLVLFNLVESKTSWKRRLPEVLGLVLSIGSIVVALNVLVAGVLFFDGSLSDMWKSYVLQNLFYVFDGNEYAARSITDHHPVHHFLLLAKDLPDTRYLVLLTAGSAVLWSPFWIKSLIQPIQGDRSWLACVLLIPLSLATAASIIAPGTFFAHYYWYLLPVLALWIPFAANGVSKPQIAHGFPRMILIAMALSATAIPLFRWFRSPDPFLRDYLRPFSQITSEVANYIRNNTPSHYRMTVWGQEPRFYAETGRIQGTRENVTHWQILPGKLQPYFLQRFVQDMRQSNPEIFLDAVTPGRFFGDTKNQSPQAFPIVADFLESNYVLVDIVDGVRFFLRNDLIERDAMAIADQSGIQGL